MTVNLNMSKIMLAAILIASFTAGAFLSYLWVVGYYVSLEINVPDKPAICIQNFTVLAENPSFFNITVLNPSFSPREARILGVQVLTGDGALHQVSQINPEISGGGYRLDVGSSETFVCSWKWASYAGQQITVMVLVEEGSGATFITRLPFVGVDIIDITLNPERGSTFSLIIRNFEDSVSEVDLERVEVIVDELNYSVETEPKLPIKLKPADSTSLLCKWNWTDYQGGTITVIVRTEQGYAARKTYTIPVYVIFNVSEVKFNPADTTRFNITLVNFEESLLALNVTSISIRLENGTVLKPINITPPLPFILNVDETAVFVCEWNWSELRNEEIIITVSTEQGYKVKVAQRVP